MTLDIADRIELAGLLERAGVVLPSDVTVVLEGDMLADGVLGRFRWWRPDEIALAGDASMLEELASTCAHELKHREQYKRNPVKYWLLSVPGLREITLEREAKRVELAVDEALGRAAYNC
jgi:hypothetical protein